MSLDPVQSFECRFFEGELQFPSTMEEALAQRELLEKVHELTLYGSFEDRTQLIQKTKDYSVWILDHVLEVQTPSAELVESQINTLQNRVTVLGSLTTLFGLSAFGAFKTSHIATGCFATAFGITTALIGISYYFELLEWQSNPLEDLAAKRRQLHSSHMLLPGQIATREFSQNGVINPTEVPTLFFLKTLSTYLESLQMAKTPDTTSDKAEYTARFFQNVWLSEKVIDQALTFEGKTHPIKDYIMTDLPDLIDIYKLFKDNQVLFSKFRRSIDNLYRQKLSEIDQAIALQIEPIEQHHLRKISLLKEQESLKLHPFQALLASRLSWIEENQDNLSSAHSYDIEFQSHITPLQQAYLEQATRLKEQFAEQRQAYIYENFGIVEEQPPSYDEATAPSAPPADETPPSYDEITTPSAPPADIDLSDDAFLNALAEKEQEILAALHKEFMQSCIDCAQTIYDNHPEVLLIKESYLELAQRFASFFELAKKQIKENFEVHREHLENFAICARVLLQGDEQENYARFFTPIQQKIDNLRNSLEAYKKDEALPQFEAIALQLAAQQNRLIPDSSKYLGQLQSTNILSLAGRSFDQRAWEALVRKKSIEFDAIALYFQ